MEKNPKENEDFKPNLKSPRSKLFSIDIQNQFFDISTPQSVPTLKHMPQSYIFPPTNSARNPIPANLAVFLQKFKRADSVPNKKRRKKPRRKITDPLFAHLSELRKELNYVKKQNELLKKRHTHAEMKKDGKNSKKSLENKKVKIESLKNDIEKLKLENSSEAENFAKIQKEYEEFKENNTREINKSVEIIQTKISNTEKRIRNLDEEGILFERKLLESHRKNKEVESENNELINLISLLSCAPKKLNYEQELKELQEKVKEKQEKLLQIKNQRIELENQNKKLNLQFSELTQKFETQENFICELSLKKADILGARFRSHEIYEFRLKETETLKNICSKISNNENSHAEPKIIEECKNLLSEYSCKMQETAHKLEKMQKEQAECKEKIKNIQKVVQNNIEIQNTRKFSVTTEQKNKNTGGSIVETEVPNSDDAMQKYFMNSLRFI